MRPFFCRKRAGTIFFGLFSPESGILLDRRADLHRQRTAFIEIEKSKEALNKANHYIANVALYEFEEGKHIEASTENVAKLTSFLLGLQQGIYKEIIWVTKEDEEVSLNLEQVIAILQGIAQVQSEIWVLKYKAFINEINNAETTDEIRAIVIDYTIDFTKED